MRTVNVHDAKTQLSKLLALVEDGEEIVIARNGRPVARLVRAEPDAVARVPGTAKGLIWYGDDFDAPLPEELRRAFEADL